MAMFHLLKIRTSIDIFKNEKCKVTFGLEYIFFKKDSHIYLNVVFCFHFITTFGNCKKSNRKAMNRNWSNKRQIPLLKPKREINKYYKLTKYNENKLLTERAAISQKVATQQPKLN